jgi:hypothetical protein
MDETLIAEAVQLYIDTVALETMDADHPEFQELYAKECQLFDLLRKMNWEESEEYKHKVWVYNIDHGISNKSKWHNVY